MSDATLTIRTDSDTKKTIANFAASVGLSTSAFITAATMQAIREGQLTLTPTPEPTPYLEKIMRQAEEDLKYNRNVTQTQSKEEAVTHLQGINQKDAQALEDTLAQADRDSLAKQQRDEQLGNG